MEEKERRYTLKERVEGGEVEAIALSANFSSSPGSLGVLPTAETAVRTRTRHNVTIET